MGIREQMESIYRELPLDRIPWNLEEPPQLLVDLIQNRKIAPCDAVDIGCGCGNYAVWLAAQGFRMTGIDISPAAIALAAQLAREKGVECRFVQGDVTEDVARHEGAFDLAYDWELLHHVFPEKRQAYIDNVHRMLRPGATHLSVCFSEENPDFGGTGKYRQTPLGTTLYFSSEEEIRELFSQKFQILELDTTAIAGKYGPHMAVVTLLKRG
jgi:2-polyprenyl-3-methyl-5-hydroxy-6-metoxy-1,4-benzoquinol methylase